MQESIEYALHGRLKNAYQRHRDVHGRRGLAALISVRVETDDGVTGYGECSDGRSPHGVVGTIEDLKPALLGQDPRAFEMRFWDMLRRTRQSPGGIAAKAIAGVELALIDIKAKALGISVVELFGGPTRDSVRVYWSHCGSSRARYPDILGTPPIRTMSDIADLGREVVGRGTPPSRPTSCCRATPLRSTSEASAAGRTRPTRWCPGSSCGTSRP